MTLYEGETPKAKDIVDGPKDGAKTEANAKALAERFTTPLAGKAVNHSKANMLNSGKLQG